MSLITDIYKLREMQETKPMREHLRDLIDAGIVGESKLEELKKYDQKIKKHSEKARKYIASETKYKREERQPKKRIKRLKKEMKEMRKNAFKEFKENHPILGNIITFPLRFPIVGDLIKRIGFQFSSEYQSIKEHIRKLKDQLTETELEACDAMLDLKEAEQKEAEYRDGRFSFLEAIEETYQKHEENLPALKDIYQNMSALKKLQDNGSIPAEFVALSTRVYEQLKDGEEIDEINGKPLDDLRATIKKLGMASRMKQEITPEALEKINKFLGNSEPAEEGQHVEGQEEVARIETREGQEEPVEEPTEQEEEQEGQEEEQEGQEEPVEEPTEQEEKQEGQEEAPKESHPSPHPTQDRRRNMKDELTEKNIFVNSSLRRDYIAAIAGDPEALCEELGNGSAKGGLAVLESAIKAAQRGKPINYDNNPMLKEVVDDYIHYLEMRSKEEAKAKDRRVVMNTGKEP